MGAAEGVVDVDVAEAGELLGEAGIVGLFFGMEAEVLEQQRLAGFELAGHLGGDLADAVGGEGDILGFVEDVVEQQAQAVDDRAQAHVSTACPWGGRGASRGSPWPCGGARTRWWAGSRGCGCRR